MKKTIFSIVLFVISASAIMAQDLYPAKFPNGKYGYIDKEGNVKIEGLYLEAQEFSEDIAWVKKEYLSERRGSFSNRWIAINTQNDSLFTTSGRGTILPNPFKCGLSRIVSNLGVKFINKTGEEKFRLRVDRKIYLDSINKDRQNSRRNRSRGDRNSNSPILPSEEYLRTFNVNTSDFDEMTCISSSYIKENNITIFYTKDGNEKFRVQGKSEGFINGFAGLNYDGRLRDFRRKIKNFINQEGQLLYSHNKDKYDLYMSFSDGMSAVKKGDKWGFIDESGRELIPLEYDYVANFSEGKAIVKKGEQTLLIDKNNDKIRDLRIPFQIPFYYEYTFSDDVCWYRDDEQWVLIYENGKIHQGTQYHTVNKFNNGIAKVSTIDDNGNIKEGYVNKSLQWIFGPF